MRFIGLLLLVCALALSPAFAEDEEAGASASPAASAAPSAAAPSAAPSAAAAGGVDPGIEACLDELIAILGKKDWEAWMERMTPPSDPSRKGDWEKKKKDEAKNWAQMMGDGSDILKNLKDIKGKEWTKSKDGKTAVLEVKTKDPTTGAESKGSNQMELVDGKWYLKI